MTARSDDRRARVLAWIIGLGFVCLGTASFVFALGNGWVQ